MLKIVQMQAEHMLYVITLQSGIKNNSPLIGNLSRLFRKNRDSFMRFLLYLNYMNRLCNKDYHNIIYYTPYNLVSQTQK